jgi:hypothetical protein
MPERLTQSDINVDPSNITICSQTMGSTQQLTSIASVLLIKNQPRRK